MIRYLLGLSVVGCMVLMPMRACNAADDKEVAKKDKTTPAVEKAIKSLFPEGEVASITKKRIKNTRRFDVIVKVEKKVKDEKAKKDDKKGEEKKEYVEHFLRLRPNGSVVERKDPIEESELPSKVKSAITKKYKKAKVTSATKLTKYKTVTYEIEVDTGKGNKTLILDEKGKKPVKDDQPQ